jgi:hypothetical protein
MSGRNLVQWAGDFLYGATKYPSGLTCPKVTIGHFRQDEKGDLQRLYFEELRQQQFRRTIWQLVFPGQTAGLIKRIPTQTDGTNEYHVRFYNDGLVDCELEVDRLSLTHWNGPRQHDIGMLEKTLEKSRLEPKIREKISQLFGVRDYSNQCTRS